MENLLAAWKEFIKGKRNKKDVQEFQLRLFDNIYNLHLELKNKNYHTGGYHMFKLHDPRPRDIHKASVRDRLLHHAVHRQLYIFLDKTFIDDSYSCREGKGTHRALNKFRRFGYKVTSNNTKTAWVLKCDIKKFFASIDQEKLLKILEVHIPDKDILSLLSILIRSFHGNIPGTGLPLGNLTSQIFVNEYMNEFDQFMKHTIKAKYYLRYTDDFIIMNQDKILLQNMLIEIKKFLHEKLGLTLHPNKVFLKTLASGIDFLGWIHFPHYRVLRTSTKRRMIKNLKDNQKAETIASYRGMLKHGNTYKLQQKVFKTQ